jgi:putative DNA primase/helicase
MKEDTSITALEAEVLSVAELLASDGIPAGFLARPDGIYEIGHDDAEPIWLCGPLSVTARFRRREGGGWGRIVTLLDPGGRLQELSLRESDIATGERKVRSALADFGLRIRPGSAARSALIRLVGDWEPATTLTSSDRLGWADDSCSGFILRDGRVLGCGEYHFAGFMPDDASQSAASAGTFDAWRENVGVLCIGNPLLVLSVSLAFAAPLLEFLGEDGGGIHLRGASSCGKTTIQRVATSVWGDPTRIGTWRVTANGVEQVAKACNSTLLALDELAEISAQDLYNAIYMLANGMGKARSNASGGVIPRAAWRVAILSTGEIGIGEKLAEGGRSVKAGQDVRLLDIEADTGLHGAFDDLHGSATGAEFSDKLKRAARGAHGTAGPAFVEHLLVDLKQRRERAARAIELIQMRLLRLHTAADDGQLLRVARRLAVIAYAGEIATNAKLTGWAKHDAIRAAEVALTLWLESRAPSCTEEVSAHALAAIELTRTFLKDNADGFTTLDANTGPNATTRHGWMLGETFLISAESWRALHGRNAAGAAHALAKWRLLVPGDGKHMAKRVRHPAFSDRPRFYTVRAAILRDVAPVEAEAEAA